MHIKQLLVEGFKTYKNLTVLPPFDARHNVIVGKNGSGKSNVFAAIQFVLGDKYSSIRSEERQNLLHEGAGRDVISASVEIIFDNSDSRFPMEKKEVSIKRTIGLKKDEYFVNSTHASKSEVQGLLEAAGLTKENQYNIVQQGKVDRLIQMSDAQRLELLKEIAGTKTYDERRKESIKIMGETDSRRNQIDEVIGQIETRLADLEDEKEELKEFQKLDSVRRSLEYAIYEKELKIATDKLENLEKSRENSSEHVQEILEEAERLRELIRVKGEKKEQLEQKALDLKGKLDLIKKDSEDYGKRKAELELRIKDYQERINAQHKMKESAAKNLRKLTQEIQNAEKKLRKVTSEYDNHLSAEEKLKHELTMREQRLHSLHAKEGRAQQFRSKAERDRFLKGKIDERMKEIAQNSKSMKKCNQNINRLRNSISSMEKSLDGKKKGLDDKHEEINKLRAAIEKLSKKRDSVGNTRKELWRDSNKIKKEQAEWNEKLSRAQSDLKHSMDRHLYSALREVKAYAAERKIKGYYGPLIELFKCPEHLRKCVETTGSNKLFHVVVDTDVTASKIITYLRQRKAGRLTFMPLNRLRSRRQNYPSTPDAVPMINQLEFEEKFRPAMTQIFGRTLITQTLELGAKFARSHGLDTITLDGDQVNNKGALTGGFIENKRSRLGAYAEQLLAASKMGKIQQRKEEVEAKVQVQNQLEAKLGGEINQKKEERRHLRHRLDEHQMENKKLAKDCELEKSKQKNEEKELNRLGAEKKELEANIRSLQLELQSELEEELNSQDQNELEDLTAETTNLKTQLIDASRLRAEAESKKKSIENDLSGNLRRREEELKLDISSQSQEEATEEFDQERNELKKLNDIVADFRAQIKDAEKAIDSTVSQTNDTQNELENLKAKIAKHEGKLQNESKNTEKFFTQRNNLLRRQKYCRKRIRDVGVLSREEYSKYDSSTVKALMTQLTKTNEKLKKFSHVNKKALDQYLSFTTQREDLLGRKTELDEGGKAIRKLIDHLDQKKDEAIQRTFKGIAKNFTEVFKKLIPNGNGRISIKKKKNADARMKVTEQYAGIGIKVSFTGGSGGDRSLKQLSGGQQSIVALALIFAIQRCDPSPFYLFDEIDANLDSEKRRSVADMILEQSKSAQFITTTFRPELLEHANKFYGVVFANKMSKVNEIDQEDARHIISQVEREL